MELKEKVKLRLLKKNGNVITGIRSSKKILISGYLNLKNILITSKKIDVIHLYYSNQMVVFVFSGLLYIFGGADHESEVDQQNFFRQIQKIFKKLLKIKVFICFVS